MLKYSIPILVLLLCSCSAGIMFNHEKATELDLHQMRVSDYQNIFGEPYRAGNVINGNGTYREVWYHSSRREFLIGNVSRRNLFL